MSYIYIKSIKLFCQCCLYRVEKNNIWDNVGHFLFASYIYTFYHLLLFFLWPPSSGENKTDNSFTHDRIYFPGQNCFFKIWKSSIKQIECIINSIIIETYMLLSFFFFSMYEGPVAEFLEPNKRTISFDYSGEDLRKTNHIFRKKRI